MSQTAGSATVDSTGEYVFQATGGCSIFRVVCDSESGNNALVNIPGLHDAGEFFPLAPGELADFRLNHGGIRAAFVKGDGGDADIRFGIISRSYR